MSEARLFFAGWDKGAKVQRQHNWRSLLPCGIFVGVCLQGKMATRKTAGDRELSRNAATQKKVSRIPLLPRALFVEKKKAVIPRSILRTIYTAICTIFNEFVCQRIHKIYWKLTIFICGEVVRSKTSRCSCCCCCWSQSLSFFDSTKALSRVI